MPLLFPLAFVFMTFILHWLWQRSRKPVYNNPVIFRDDGNLYLYGAGWLSLVGFVISMVIVSQ